MRRHENSAKINGANQSCASAQSLTMPIGKPFACARVSFQLRHSRATSHFVVIRYRWRVLQVVGYCGTLLASAPPGVTRRRLRSPRPVCGRASIGCHPICNAMTYSAAAAIVEPVFAAVYGGGGRWAVFAPGVRDLSGRTGVHCVKVFDALVAPPLPGRRQAVATASSILQRVPRRRFTASTCPFCLT
jgi:hypothetical protein